ncbi:pfs [Arthroderma uncinatum]|uniref:pfs n=1 Tax=Arthroderma uncinatum TaxID=74035 RepID=UPI00144A97C3|nr:pfs [Arthroderma uncinatum]KAF3480150.1 pfs [Arthroderma uncinatum]
MNDWWTDFSNNLATDLSPLIALFGEAPTKQYLSECLNVTDIIIFAMAPLGIITTVVSAIRVCGTPSLRAFIGRAQEGAGNAEAELCSSTSREVCELYNNGGIARVFGRPKLLEIVHDPNATIDDFYHKGPAASASAGIYLFKDYLKKDKQEWKEINKRASDEEKVPLQPDADQEERDFAQNPNLSLNVGIKQATVHWFTAAAIFGIILQSSVLVWAILSRYTVKNVRKDLQDLYAVPLAVIGTFFLCVGVALCASLIEGSTKERVFERKIKESISQKDIASQGEAVSQVYWVQPGTQFVGDQAFDSFAYTHPKNQFTRYITSWKTKKSEHDGIWVWAGISCTAIGFLLQFLGLRACHSSVAVVQLGVTIVMSVVRSMLRANRIKEEEVFLAHQPDLYQGHELDWLALNIGTDIRPTPSGHAPGPKWELSSARRPDSVDISEKGWKLLDKKDSSQTQPFPNKYTEFRKMSVSHTGKCLLTGFRLDSGYTKERQDDQCPEDWWDFRLASGWRADIQFAPEKWRAEMQLKPKGDKLTGVQDDFAKAFLYRTRLARLTDSWSEALVSVRGTARVLAHAIEATMHVFLTTNVRFEKGWNAAFTLFWAVQCSLDKEETTKGNVYLSLTREIDINGRSGGTWHAEESELEAVLGLWLWSLRSINTKVHTPLKRILSVKSDSATGRDLTMDFDLWREGGGSSIEITEAQKNPQGLPLFGRHNIPANSPAGITVLGLPAATKSLPMMCAQEIYSLFFTSIVHAIKDIGGETEVQKNRDFSLTNTNISKIQEAFTESGLGSSEDAFSCIFPALAIQEKLPSVLKTLSNAREIADMHTDEKRWEEAEQLLLWALPHSLQSRMPLNPGDDQTRQTELINDHRLLILSLCECYRKALLDGQIEFCLSGIIKMLDDPTFKSLEDIPLVAADGPELPEEPEDEEPEEEEPEAAEIEESRNVIRYSDGENEYSQGEQRTKYIGKVYSYTLAETVRSYGIAALQVAQSEAKAEIINKLRTKLLAGINDKGTPCQFLGYKNTNQCIKEADDENETTLFRAVCNDTLDSVLFSLNPESITNDNENGGKAIFLAAQKGWYVVVKALIDNGAALERKDAESRTALSHAAQSGDINTFKYLLGKGAFPNYRDHRPWTPLFYAAYFGRLSIIKELLADGRVEPGLKDRERDTPLSWAAFEGQTKAVELLLAKEGGGFEFERQSRRNTTLLSGSNGVL